MPLVLHVLMHGACALIVRYMYTCKVQFNNIEIKYHTIWNLLKARDPKFLRFWNRPCLCPFYFSLFICFTSSIPTVAFGTKERWSSELAIVENASERRQAWFVRRLFRAIAAFISTCPVLTASNGAKKKHIRKEGRKAKECDTNEPHRSVDYSTYPGLSLHFVAFARRRRNSARLQNLTLAHKKSIKYFSTEESFKIIFSIKSAEMHVFKTR